MAFEDFGFLKPIVVTLAFAGIVIFIAMAEYSGHFWTDLVAKPVAALPDSEGGNAWVKILVGFIPAIFFLFGLGYVAYTWKTSGYGQ